MKKLFLFLIFSISILNAQSFDRNVLVEIFTNSHCVLCPAAHSTLNSYLNSQPGADQIRYIYYHMSFPYSNDPLNNANPADAAARNNYYGPFSSTPRAFFDGETQSGSYSTWASKLNSLTATKTPVQINLSGTKSGADVELKADITMEQMVTGGDFVIHFIVVEDVNYTGVNGISNHTHVMRKMITGGNGESLPVTNNQEVSKLITLSDGWQTSNLAFVVFVQSAGSKDVYQSEIISYSDLTITSLEAKSTVPSEFKLEQNYPNPFNPNTTITYTIPVVNAFDASGANVSLKVFNVLGNEIATLVNESKSPGFYSVNFDATGLPSGIYFYRLQVGNFSEVRKMTILK